MANYMHMPGSVAKYIELKTSKKTYHDNAPYIIVLFHLPLCIYLYFNSREKIIWTHIEGATPYLMTETTLQDHNSPTLKSPIVTLHRLLDFLTQPNTDLAGLPLISPDHISNTQISLPPHDTQAHTQKQEHEM